MLDAEPKNICYFKRFSNWLPWPPNHLVPVGVLSIFAVSFFVIRERFIDFSRVGLRISKCAFALRLYLAWKK